MLQFMYIMGFPQKIPKNNHTAIGDSAVIFFMSTLIFQAWKPQGVP